MNVLLITHSSDNGLNFRQMMEVQNLINNNNEVSTIKMADMTQNSDIQRADKIIMIVPEWNGSFPWTFKKMIDDSEWPSSFNNKSILLIGTSNTTFGNIMGITHLQHILSWCGAKVYHKRVSVPNIDKKFANNNIVVDERMNATVKEFIDC